MRRLRSARVRRRLLWLGAVGVIVVAVAGLTRLLPAPEPRTTAPTDAGAPKIVGRERSVPLKARDRRAINRLLSRFIPAAVDRRDPETAYALATPELRRSATRAEWRRGEMPVYPYPAGDRSWTLNFSYPKHVNIDVFMQPREGARIGPIAFTVDLKSIGGRWRVDSFFPTAIFPEVKKGGQPLAQPDLSPQNVQGTSQTGRSRLSRAWFLIPIVLVGGALLIPLAYFLAGALRARRARRAYAGAPKTLPPLPVDRVPPERVRDPVA